MKLYGEEIASRLLIGTSLYPSPTVMEASLRASGAEIVTVSVRREAAGAKAGDSFWTIISSLGVRVLPNTAGCRTVKDAVTTAQLARELFDTAWIKLEVIGDEETLQPDVVGLVEAAGVLVRDGFQVFPYCTEDLTVVARLIDVGCELVMPWASPIGSARGLMNPYALKSLRARFPDVPMIIDAGLGAPSQAAEALEMGFDAVLLNTAIAKAGDPAGMARAFRLAVEAGRAGFEAGLMQPRDMAAPSTPVVGTPFWHAAAS
jgi:thiazole synthase